MVNADLVIETVRSHPDPYAYFLEPCQVWIQIRNRAGHSMRIEKIELLFVADETAGKFVPFITPSLMIEDKHLSNPIRIEFPADLSFRSGTNVYRIKVHYRTDSSKVLDLPSGRFIIFTSLGDGNKQFFISHKDPHDTSNARLLALFLKKVGFTGYIAEDDQRPGVDFWNEKIPKAIKASLGAVILWTKKAAKDPENIKREIKIAKSLRKRLVMAAERGIRIPRIFPKKKIEYYDLKNPASPDELKRLGCSIWDTYQRGGYS